MSLGIYISREYSTAAENLAEKVFSSFANTIHCIHFRERLSTRLLQFMLYLLGEFSMKPSATVDDFDLPLLFEFNKSPPLFTTMVADDRRKQWHAYFSGLHQQLVFDFNPVDNWKKVKAYWILRLTTDIFPMNFKIHVLNIKETRFILVCRIKMWTMRLQT